MDQLEEGLAISIGGPEAEAALAAFGAQMENWGLAAPDVPPLVLDFGMGDFARYGLIEYWIANELDAGYCGKYLYVSDGQTCPEHHHQQKMETFFIVKGAVDVLLDGEQRRLTEGDVLPVKQGMKHSFTGAGPCLLLEISRPCVVADNTFTDSRVPYGTNYRPQ
jgi:mannose-6-phosphate isomerase-like protein (cupin superfamily)